ncbi:MAG: 6-phosphofructokinase [Ignavibacteria bacterium]|nr:MAG: 6-phosphofructokinase [Ignavibacteria bacterium]
MNKSVGVLTAGGDSPGLNAAIRALGKAAIGAMNMNIIGFRDGFRGLVENRIVRLDKQNLSGILTLGGTILGTSRDKPHRMNIGGKSLDMTDVIVENYHKHHLDALVCIGGGGTHKNAYRLLEKGLNIITLPKTIDNDLEGSDTTIGFDTALSIATESIDRLHSTAHSHHRIIVLEVMGHNTGWLALGAGVSGGADVILIPEIPYDIKIIEKSILRRSRGGKNFSIVVVAEGALPRKEGEKLAALVQKKRGAKSKDEKEQASKEIQMLERESAGHTMRLAHQLEERTGLESRLTILGHLQRGGAPTAADRLLATRLGTACASFIQEGRYGIMVASRGQGVEAIPLADVVGKRKVVPLDHPWIESARGVGTCLGDGQTLV